MKEFRIKQDWGKGSTGAIHFSLPIDPTEDFVKESSIHILKEDWYKHQNSVSIMQIPKPCRPTVIVDEVKNGVKVRNGISLKFKWR